MKVKTIQLGRFTFSYKNFREFILLYLGIYIYNGYRFNSFKDNPYIIDCGSHIGVSVIRFKKRYPKSKILSFEPNPETFKILERNIKQNNLKGVELINAAVGDKDGSIDFYINTSDSWSWGDSIYKSWFIKDIKNGFKKLKVRQVVLSKYLNEEVDLLKINVEGSETLVMKEIASKLKNVREIHLHYHGEASNRKNNLDEIFRILDMNSYVYMIKQLRRFGIPKNVTKSTINKREPYFLFIHARKQN